MLRGLYNVLIVAPADFVAYIFCIPIGLAPIAATIAAWLYVVKIMDGKTDGRPSGPLTFIIAGVISLYVLVVSATAIMHFPHLLHAFDSADTDE